MVFFKKVDIFRDPWKPKIRLSKSRKAVKKGAKTKYEKAAYSIRK